MSKFRSNAILVLMFLLPLSSHAGNDAWTWVGAADFTHLGGYCPGPFSTIDEAVACANSAPPLRDGCLGTHVTSVDPVPYTTGFGTYYWDIYIAWDNAPDNHGAGCPTRGYRNVFQYKAVNCPAWAMQAGTCDPQPFEKPANFCGFGNPCSPATGEKYQTFSDYDAPGIHFTHSWRSKPGPATAYGGYWTTALGSTLQRLAVLPWGWTHSYAMKIVLAGGNIVGITRPDGALLMLTTLSSGVLAATDGSGVQVRGTASTDVRVYLPDGRQEVYKLRSCSGSTAHRLEEVIDTAGRITYVQYATCDPSLPPTRILGPFGHTLDIEYNTAPGTPRPFIHRLVDASIYRRAAPSRALEGRLQVNAATRVRHSGTLLA